MSLTIQSGVFGEKGAYAQDSGLMSVVFAALSLVDWNDLTLATGVLCAG